jgi:hypothetical protein
MVSAEYPDQTPMSPPSDPHRRSAALPLDALQLVRQLQLLALCRVAVHLAHQQYPPHCRLAGQPSRCASR